MSNTVTIRASRCIYVITYEEYQTFWKPYIPYPLFIQDGKKYVTFEYGQDRFHLDETYFKAHVIPMVPYELKFQALRRGKGYSRYEKSYNKKGVVKHATNYRT